MQSAGACPPRRGCPMGSGGSPHAASRFPGVEYSFVPIRRGLDIPAAPSSPVHRRATRHYGKAPALAGGLGAPCTRAARLSREPRVAQRGGELFHVALFPLARHARRPATRVSRSPADGEPPAASPAASRKPAPWAVPAIFRTARFAQPCCACAPSDFATPWLSPGLR